MYVLIKAKIETACKNEAHEAHQHAKHNVQQFVLCDMTRAYVLHASFIFLTFKHSNTHTRHAVEQLVLCDMTHSVCDTTYSYV